jgi:hypothetical protein
MVEGDPTTNTDCLYGATDCNSSTQGDWVTDTPYPIIDNSDIADAYQIAYYPTIYTICPNGIVTETSQITAEQHYSFIEADDCQSVFANDATLLNYSGTVGTCDEAELIVDLANLGSSPLTSLNIMVTGVTPMVNYNWTGDLSQFGVETVNLGNVSVNDGEDVIIAITNIDDNIMNNALTPAVGATEATTHIHIDLLTDVYPGDYLWEIYDDSFTLVASGGPYADFDVQMDPIQVNEDVYLPATGCYNFVLIDQYGDGMYAGAHCYVYGVTSGGTAMSNILEIGDAGLLFEEVLGAAEVTEVVGITESSVVNVLGAYPNPAADVLNVNYELTVSGQTSMSVINMLGETIMVENLGNRIQGEYNDRLDVSELPAGMYMINLNAAGNVTSFRITVK